MNSPRSLFTWWFLYSLMMRRRVRGREEQCQNLSMISSEYSVCRLKVPGLICCKSRVKCQSVLKKTWVEREKKILILMMFVTKRVSRTPINCSSRVDRCCNDDDVVFDDDYNNMENLHCAFGFLCSCVCWAKGLRGLITSFVIGSFQIFCCVHFFCSVRDLAEFSSPQHDVMNRIWITKFYPLCWPHSQLKKYAVKSSFIETKIHVSFLCDIL